MHNRVRPVCKPALAMSPLRYSQEQQTLTKERLEKHEQGFVRWAKGGINGLIDPLKARDAMLKAS